MDETKHEVTFTYVDDKTPVIEVIQKVTNESCRRTPLCKLPERGGGPPPLVSGLLLNPFHRRSDRHGCGIRRKEKKRGADRLKQLYFYGSNMDLDQMAYRCPKAEMSRNRPPGGVSADLCSRRKWSCHHLPGRGNHVTASSGH